MASSGNFATLNPLVKYSIGTFSNGNLTYASSSDDGYTSTIGLNFKSYCEVRVDVISNDGGTIGFRGATDEDEYFDVVSFQENYQSGKIYHYKGNSSQSVSTADIGGTVSAGNIIMMAYDPATYKWWVGVNGTWRNSGDPANGTGFVFQGSATMFENMGSIHWGAWNGTYTHTITFNFGQDSTFGGQETAGGNADGNGFGDFKYSPPTGFLATCSGNIAISDDIDPAQTDDDYPAKNFNTVLFDGNGSSNAVTGLGFKPDLIWGFTRSGSQSKRVVDSTRGGSERLYSDLGSAASTGTATISAFGTDGFTATGGAFNNDSGKTCGSWCWKANGGTTTSFSAGGNQLAGTYQANTKSKFSIITYTGSGSANSEVLHGLGATPNFIIFKARNDTHWWGVYHKSSGTVNTGYDSLLYINSTNALASGQNVNIVPDSTKIVMSGNEQINRSSSYNYVMYAWADVEGMQKFGTYEGNGNADGPFVYTGFRPRMLFTKRTENAGGWRVRDTARDTYNPSTKISWWDSSSIEYSNSAYSIDILSNGFKIRTSSNDFNASEKWIYGAWGDVPFKYNNTF